MEAGDTTWIQPLVGDKHCIQQKAPNGNYLNHGRYTVISPTGKLLLEGHFNFGKKTGTWTQYDEKGNRIVEKYYQDGREDFGTPAPKAPSADTKKR